MWYSNESEIPIPWYFHRTSPTQYTGVHTCTGSGGNGLFDIACLALIMTSLPHFVLTCH